MTVQTHSFTYEPEGSEESYDVELDITANWHPAEPDVGIFNSYCDIDDWSVSINGQSVASGWDNSLASDPSGGVVYDLSRWLGLNERAFAKEVQAQIKLWEQSAEPPEPDYDDDYRD